MLNPDLFLNETMFDKDAPSAPTRNGYGEGLMVLGETHPNVVALSADLTESTRTDAFAKAHPDRFIQVGVAEQNMAAVAAGLAVSGKIPYIASYATFSPGKNWETIRTTAVYNQANVKIAGHHAGIMTGPDGATHQATEDIAITRCWPDISIFVPCDSVEAKKATVVSADIDGPVYLRFSRDKTPIMTTEKTPFVPGDVQAFWIEDKPEVTIFACGYMLHYALLAAKGLEALNIKVLVANVPTIKPLQTKQLVELAGKSGAVVTVEDHQVMGGLGGMIAETLGLHQPMPIEYIGLQNTFAESGDPAELVEKYGMGASSIQNAVRRVIKRKKE